MVKYYIKGVHPKLCLQSIFKRHAIYIAPKPSTSFRAISSYFGLGEHMRAFLWHVPNKSLSADIKSRMP